MDFLKKSIMNPQFLADSQDTTGPELPELYDATQNLKFSNPSRSIGNRSSSKVNSPEMNMQPTSPPLKQPIVNLKSFPKIQPLKLNNQEETKITDALITVINSNQPLMKELAEQIDEFEKSQTQRSPSPVDSIRVTVESATANINKQEAQPLSPENYKFEDFFGPVQQKPSSKQNSTNQPQEASKKANSNQPKDPNDPDAPMSQVNAFFRIDQKDLLVSCLETFMDMIIQSSELTASQCYVFRLIGIVVKLVLQCLNTYVSLEPEENYILAKNISYLILTTHGDKLEAMLIPASGPLVNTKSAKAKAIMFLLAPIIIRVAIRKVYTKIRRPPVANSETLSISASKRKAPINDFKTNFPYNAQPAEKKIKSVSPFEEDKLESEIHVTKPPPPLKLPKFNNKAMRLEIGDSKNFMR